jgi:hypothetical protein
MRQRQTDAQAKTNKADVQADSAAASAFRLRRATVTTVQEGKDWGVQLADCVRKGVRTEADTDVTSAL